MDAWDKSKGKWHHPIMIIPPQYRTSDGKEGEPERMDGFMLIALRELQRLAPPPSASTTGMDRKCSKLWVPDAELGMYKSPFRLHMKLHVLLPAAMQCCLSLCHQFA